jgi:signal transduction histidine kinase
MLDARGAARPFISTQAPSPGERKLALWVVAASALIFVVAIPFATQPLAPVPAFIPVYQSALVVNDLMTAILLFGQFSILRSRALVFLASAYLFSALMAAIHMLTFPGLFAPGGLLGAGAQSTAWIYMFWHAGFPLLAIAYTLGKQSMHRVPRPGAAIVWATLAAAAAASLLALLATMGQSLLPAIMQGNRYTPSMIVVVSSTWTLSVVALALAWRRQPHSVLDLWLMVVLCAWIFDIALAAVFNAGRFDLGFYGGRIYGLLAATFVLVVLLLENSGLYARLLRGYGDEIRLREAAERRLSERLRLMHEIDRAVVAEQPAEAIAGAVIQRLRELLGVPRAIVNRFDLAAAQVEWVAAAGRKRTHVGPGVRYSIALMGDVEALRRGETQTVDVGALADGPDKRALLASGVKVYLAVPMIAGGELIGALSFGGESRHFPPEQVGIAREVATQLAIAVTQARLLERVRRHADELEVRVAERTAELHEANRELRLLHAATLDISKAPDSNIALTVLLEKVCEFTGWGLGQSWLPDGERLALAPAWTRTVTGVEEFRRQNERLGFAPEGGALERVWKTGRVDWVWDLQPDPQGVRRPLMIAAGLKSWVGFPVLAGGEVVAVLDFFDTEVRPRDERVLALIAALARQIGPVIQNKRAADEIVRLNDILQRNADELEASNKELESFSYSVSHDLRAPLRAVDGYARMLEEDHGASLDAEGRRLLGVVRESSQKMGQLIDDLLAFSRLSRQGLAKRPVDMTDLARQVTRELTRATNGMTVDIAALPVATGDPSLLKQVWINLVGNAIKYSGKRDAARVEIGGREENGEAQYWVRDNGVGFDPRYAAKLFGVFQRLHRADEFPGTGVGLAIVHRVVTRHGGRVWAESELGKGASFYFALPK